jgi:hypothetical protein
MGAGFISQVSQDTNFYEWFILILRFLEFFYALTR